MAVWVTGHHIPKKLRNGWRQCCVAFFFMSIFSMKRFHACHIRGCGQSFHESRIEWYDDEADVQWYQPVHHVPTVHPAMSPDARCFRQPFSRAIAVLLAQAEALEQR